MGDPNTIKILASLFRASNEARPILLLGAGASFSSGVPTAAESVRRIARRVYAEKIRGGAVLPEQVKLSEWQTWLQGQPWFIKGEDRLAENFPLVVEQLLRPREYRMRTLLSLLQPGTDIGSGYRRLADFVMKGLIRTILTTNFDTCLPIALNERRTHIPYIAEVNRGPDDLREFSLFNRAQIVWLHGKAEQYTDRNLAGEVDKLDRKLVELMQPMLADSPLVVIGYRGAEPSIMEHLLLKSAKRTLNFKNGIYWCLRQGESPHPHVQALQREIGDNLRILQITGFDELLEALAHELTDEDLYPRSIGRERAANSIAFDDREMPGSSYADLDQDAMLPVMREYCEKLGRVPVTHETLPGLLREQGFLVTVGSSELVTAGALLLFGREPQKFFPHAVVSATISGKKRIVFSGNLLQQRAALLDWLADEELNPTLKVKRRTTHATSRAYPDRALTELLVNMIVHRDYDRTESASIDVQPGQAITFANPGGLLDCLAKRLALDEAGVFRPIPNLSELRNRSLCDVFFGIRAMEREGTGLTDVEELARSHGGDVQFKHDVISRAFIARISQPVASIGSTTIARDDRPKGVYVLNALPFASMPERVSVVRLTEPLATRPQTVSLADAGTFLHRDDELWSFVPLPILSSVLGPLVDAKRSRSASRAEVEADQEQRKVLCWLLRKHFEFHLQRFQRDGLILEEGRKRGRRAYFVGNAGKGRKHLYDTPRRRRVPREVVKQRGDPPKAWFENEGFGYEITQLDGTWAVRIKPFYMFTGRDAKTPLPPFARTSRATRRIKFDRNRNVDDDLTFWARFLGEGRPAINLGQRHVEDLILGGQFLTIEVPEQGLLRDSNESKDRLPA